MKKRLLVFQILYLISYVLKSRQHGYLFILQNGKMEYSQMDSYNPNIKFKLVVKPMEIPKNIWKLIDFVRSLMKKTIQMYQSPPAKEERRTKADTTLANTSPIFRKKENNENIKTYSKEARRSVNTVSSEEKFFISSLLVINNDAEFLKRIQSLSSEQMEIASKSDEVFQRAKNIAMRERTSA